MTNLKKLALTSAFAAFAVTSAQAATEVTFFPKLESTTDSIAGVDVQVFDIESLVKGVSPTRVAGDSFADEFVIGIQDSQQLDLSFFAQPNSVKSGRGFVPGVSFTGFTLYDYTGSMVFSPMQYDAESGFVSGDWWLYSGTYDLEITGTINANGGGYSGQAVVGVVPEPTGWALMMAGLGAVGMLARRRKNLG